MLFFFAVHKSDFRNAWNFEELLCISTLVSYNHIEYFHNSILNSGYILFKISWVIKLFDTWNAKIFLHLKLLVNGSYLKKLANGEKLEFICL